MKKIILSSMLLMLITLTCFSQVPNAMSYQAVVRSSNGDIIANQNVSFRISILQGSESGSSVYNETHNTTTNNFGLANLKIGLGTIESGVFDPSGWGMDLHFIKIEFDPDGGSNFIHMGTSQLLSVPYAFHAQTVEEDNVDDADNDPVNEIQTLSINGNTLELSNGGSVELPVAEGGDNWGNQIVETDATLNGNGTAGNPLTVNGDLSDDQQLSLSGNDLSISGGNSITLPQTSNYWSKNYADELYYNLNVGIGTANPQFELDIYDETTACAARIKSKANNAMFFIDRKGSSNMAYMCFTTSDIDGFYTGLLANSNYRISSDIANLKGLEVTRDGDINLSGDLLLGTNKNLGIGVDSPVYDIDLLSASSAINIKADGSLFKSGSAFCIVDKASTSKYAEVMFRDAGTTMFYTGLLGNNNYRISTTSSTLNGIEIESDGDVVVSDEVHTPSTGAANMLPYAYGYVTGGVVLDRGTDNIASVEWNVNHFVINIPDLDDYIVLVTPSTDAVNERVVYDTNKFHVYWRDEGTYMYVHCDFSFVVFKL